jgi:hypothetical protein
MAKADGRDGRDRGDESSTAAGRRGPRKGTVESALQASLVFHRLRVPFAGRVSSSGGIAPRDSTVRKALTISRGEGGALQDHSPSRIGPAVGERTLAWARA